MYIFMEAWRGLNRVAVLKDDKVVFARGRSWDGEIEVWTDEELMKELVEKANKYDALCK